MLEIVYLIYLTVGVILTFASTKVFGPGTFFLHFLVSFSWPIILVWAVIDYVITRFED